MVITRNEDIAMEKVTGEAFMATELEKLEKKFKSKRRRAERSLRLRERKCMEYE
jgi:hypothetical protein